MRCMQRLWVGLFVFLFGIQALAGERQWVEVRSKNFSLITESGEKPGRAALLRFEQMRGAFGTIFKRAKVNSPVPVQIVAFDNNKEMKNYVPLWKGKPVELAGLFQGSDDRNFILLDLSAEGGWSTVFHEYAHMLINANLPPMPLWFDEGYAEYCSSLNVSGKDIEFGRVPQDVIPVLRETNWMKTADLFSVQHDSKDYNEQERRGVFYAQSWLTVHYIMEKNLGKQLDAYLNAVRNNVPVAEAIKQGFGMEPAQLDKLLGDYFRVGVMKFLRLNSPPEIDGGPYEVRALPALEAHAILADVHYHSLDYRAQGIEEFKAILKSDPDNVLANRGLGYALLQKNEFTAAGEYIRRAAAKDNSDARLHYFQAMLLYRASGGAGSTEGIDEMRADLQKAISIDPNFADAYSLLAYTDQVRKDYPSGVQNARTAVELNPRGQHLQMNLAMAQMQDQDWDGAKATLTQLKSSSDASVATAAERNLQQLEEMRAAIEHPHVRVLSNREAPPADASEPAPKAVPDTRPIKFLKGQLTAVNCSAAPAAVLSVLAQGKRLQMRVADTAKLVIVGADKFSCDWTNKRVAVNYRGSSDAGDVVSLEIQ